MKAPKSMRELSESGELKHFVDRELIKALDHPVREHILAVLNERIASAREIGEELGADVSSFYHHVEELERLGCIERIESRRRRGALEHFFRAKRTLFFDDEAWEKIPASLRSDLAVNSLQRLFDDVVVAIEGKTFHEREDAHVSWAPGAFDAQGWSEATDLMNETIERLRLIQEAAAQRLRQSGNKGMSATLGILGFEMPSQTVSE